MSQLRRPKGPAKWAGLAMLAGVLTIGPVVLMSSPASADCTAFTAYLKLTVPAHQCTISGTATVTGGTLSVGATSGTIKWAAAPLNGRNLTIATDDRMQLVDATGSGSGWNLTATATRFTDSTGTTRCSSTKPCTLPSTALSLAKLCHTPVTPTVTFPCSWLPPPAPPGVACSSGSSCTLPTDSVTYPVTIPACTTASGTCTPTSVANAAKTTGMGAMTFTTLDWWLNIPANAYAGKYTSTITLTISSGP